MSVFLVTSSFVTTLLIPPAEFQDGGEASGRALAYLAHGYLGNAFGTVYDVSTIAILWFAGASAMAGLLNLIPRYLPRYGMAPELGARRTPAGAGAHRHRVPGHLDLRRRRQRPGRGVRHRCPGAVHLGRYGGHAGRPARRAAQAVPRVRGRSPLVFVYTTVDNVIERPDGVKIGACFIAGILAVSVASRLTRAFELRTTDVRLDATAELFLRDCARRTIRLVANEPDARDREEYDDKLRQIRADHDLPDDTDVIFVEVTVADPSDFEIARSTCAGGDARQPPGAGRPVVVGAQRAGGAAAARPRPDRGDARTSTSSGPRATRPRTSLRFLLLRRRRGRAGDPRGAAPRRAAAASGARTCTSARQRSAAHNGGMVPMSPERVVVALTGGPEGEVLLRRAAGIVDRSPGGELPQRVRRPARPRRHRRPGGAGAAARADRGPGRHAPHGDRGRPGPGGARLRPRDRRDPAGRRGLAARRFAAALKPGVSRPGRRGLRRHRRADGQPPLRPRGERPATAERHWAAVAGSAAGCSRSPGRCC